MRLRTTVFSAFILSLCVIAAVSTLARAQTPEPWTKPVNLSLSGSASQPVIGLGRNGAAHALWWDQIDGARYARGVVTGTQTTWSRTVAAPTIFGDRQVDSATGRTALTPPGRLEMAVDGAGAAHAVWFGRNDRLQYSQTQAQGNTWLTAQLLSDDGLAASITSDVTGTARIAYVQASSTAASPAGVYYATRAGGALRRTLVYSSTYFRTATAFDVNVSVSADVSGTIVVAWNQAREEQSLYARSTDAGRTWSAPQPIVPRSNELGAAGRVSVAGVPDGSLLLIWRDTSAAGCGFTQRRSTDGGETWSAPERILPGLVRCPEDWAFGYSDDGKVWQLGFPEGEIPLRNVDGSLAAWDGASWSNPVSVQFSYFDETSQRTRGLGCLNFALAGQNIMLIGCDSRNDVWVAQNAVALNALLPALSSPWSSPDNLASTITGRYASGGTRDLTIAAGAQDRTYALWSQTEQAGAPGTALFASVLANGQWTDAAQVMRLAPANAANATASDEGAVKVDWPSLAVDGEDRLHVVWSGGANGRIFYSNAFGRDANTSQGWRAPMPLPLPAATSLGSSTDIVADPRGKVLYVAYIVPFNEGRGVYLTQSTDGGEMWKQPTLVFDAAAAGWDSLDAVRMALDARTNTLHVLWLKTGPPGSTAPRAVYYARSTDGVTWTSPVKIAEGDIAAPQIALSDQTLALAWTSAQPAPAEGLSDAWFAVSPDGGNSWAASDRVPGMENLTGRVSLIGDGAGRLYMVGAGRGPSGTGALLFTQWQGNEWSGVATNSLGQAAETGNYAVAALSAGKGELGAVLRVQALQADGLSVNVPLGTFRTVVPAQLAPLATFTPEPTGTPPPTMTPPPTAPPPVVLPTTSAASGSSASQGPSFIFLAGGLVVLVIVIGAIVSFMLRRRR